MPPVVCRIRTLVLAAGALLAGCAGPVYQPLLLFVPGLEGERALRACLEPLRPFFPRTPVLGADLLLTEWVPETGSETVVKRRAEIAAQSKEGGTLLLIAVHRLRLGTSPFAHPVWVEDGGDHGLERQLLEALRDELGGRQLKPAEAGRLR